METHTRLMLSNPSVMGGKPIVAGARITVELILGKLAASETLDQILHAHPRLTGESVQAALALSAEAPHPDVCIRRTRQAITVRGRWRRFAHPDSMRQGRITAGPHGLAWT